VPDFKSGCTARYAAAPIHLGKGPVPDPRQTVSGM